jgi:putative flippase GtrA
MQPVAQRAEAAKAMLLRRVPKRFHAITDELAKFGTIGLINLVVNFAVFNLLWLTFLRSGEVKAKAVATIVATTCAYFLNRHWTYRHRPKSTLRREYTLFFLFNLVGLVIEVAVVGVAKYGFHQTHILVLNLCTALGIALGTIFRFWSYRTHVFKAVEPEPVTSEAALAAAIAGADPVAVEADLDWAEADAFLGTTPIDGMDAELYNEDDADEDRQLHHELVQLEFNDIVNEAERPAHHH